MKALVKYEKGPGNMEIRDIPEPKAGPGMVKIEVKEAGICGSDIHIYHSDIAIPVNPPVVTGHEFSGRKTLGYWYNGIFTKYTVVPLDT